MRPAVEPQRGSFAFGVSPPRQITRKQHRADARDVSLESQRQQTELNLDVFVEGLGNSDGNTHVGWRDRRSLHCNLQPAFDLADILSVFFEPHAIGGAGLVTKTREAAAERIENTAVSRSACSPLIDGTAVAEHALEDDLRV